MTDYDFYNTQFYRIAQKNIQDCYMRNAQFQADMERREAERQLYMQRQQAAIAYMNQIPYQSISMNPSGLLQAQYVPMENNFINYWTDYSGSQNNTTQYQQDSFRNCFKTALEIASHATKEQYPAYSLIFDSLGYMTADNFAEAAMKAASMINTIMKLGQ